MKVIFASRYVDPINPKANRNIVSQARILTEDFGIDLEILTWPTNDLWGGVLPDKIPTTEPLMVKRNGLNYSVILAPLSWNEIAGGNIMSDQAWESAVVYGMNLLAAKKPDIFHLHHRFGFWWLLESAQRLGIPTVYSNYDWGIACLRTVLVNEIGKLCDGLVNPTKCAACIKKGRKGLAGRANEALAETWVGQKILTSIDQSTMLGPKFRALGAVSKPAIMRTEMHQQRVRSVFKGLGHCITPSKFGKHFFQQFGITDKKITVLPWPHEKVTTRLSRFSCSDPFTITFIGRVSPDKGVHLIFEALEQLGDIPSVLLRVAGADESEYSLKLKAKYPELVGIHRVEWQGWSPIDQLLRTTDVTVIPSTWMDNTPLTLIEALAYQVPVIATDIPTITDLLTKGTGYLAEYNSVDSLSLAIRMAVSDKELIRSGSLNFKKIQAPTEYGKEILNIYSKLLDEI
jgi:glycosyltransferase involved in cell wall biosynthesis